MRIEITLLSLLLSGTAALSQGEYDSGEGHYRDGYDMDRFRASDVDGDGTVSWEEARAAHWGPEALGGRRRFDAADRDGDGRLTPSEAGIQKHWEMRNRKAIAKGVKENYASAGRTRDAFYRKYDTSLYTHDRFDQTDRDGDGTLSKDELRQEQRWTEIYRGDDRFRSADKDRDGSLSLEETRRQKQWEKDHRRSLERDAWKDTKKRNRRDRR